MYNPQNLHECEIEKKKKRRAIVDTLMTIVGLIASVSSVPQIIKIWETGTVSGISLMTYAIAWGAVFAWFLYGAYIRNKPLMITSAISTLVLGIVIIQIFVYSQKSL
tara:strand:+ start:1845 stop:2165 length:321 start_codon:yes stop_codon:yes gene_type:complete